MSNNFAKNAYLKFMLWGILSSMGVTFCTLIDAMMIGHFIGSDGLAVTSLSNFVFLFLGLIAITLAVGANVLIGQNIGAYNYEKANDLFKKVLSVGLVISLIFTIISLIFKSPFLSLLGASGKIKDLLGLYLLPVFFFTPIFILYNILVVSVRTDSDPGLAGIASVVLIIVNLCLDLIFMGVFDMGVLGASLSMCIGEVCAFFVLLFHFKDKKHILTFGFKKPDFKSIKDFIVNGFGVGSFYIFQALVVLFFNNLLLKNQDSGVTYVAIYGVIFTISQIPAGIFDGAGNAFGPVVSIFAGENDYKSMNYVLKVALRYICIINIFVVLIFFFNAKEILAFFSINNFIGDLVFKIYSISVLFTCINSLITSYWQCIGRPVFASLMSLFRNLLLMLIIGYFLIRRTYIVGLVLTYLVVEFICSLVILAVYLKSPSKRFVEKKYSNNDLCFEKYYVIKKESMQDISSDLDNVIETWDVDMKTAFKINFICEEILLNIIKFGLSDNKKECYIDIKLIKKNDESYVLRIRDNVNDYNPFDTDGDEIDNGVIKLIKSKTKYYNYERKLIFNYLFMVI